jgi:hypothetical protein
MCSRERWALLRSSKVTDIPKQTLCIVDAVPQISGCNLYMKVGRLRCIDNRLGCTSKVATDDGGDERLSAYDPDLHVKHLY